MNIECLREIRVVTFEALKRADYNYVWRSGSIIYRRQKYKLLNVLNDSLNVFKNNPYNWKRSMKERSHKPPSASAYCSNSSIIFTILHLCAFRKQLTTQDVLSYNKDNTEEILNRNRLTFPFKQKTSIG